MIQQLRRGTVSRQERISSEAPSNHLASPNSAVGLYPTLEPSACLPNGSESSSQADADDSAPIETSSSVYLLGNTSSATTGSSSGDLEDDSSSSAAPTTNRVGLREMSGSALPVRVELPLPPAPEFVSGPRWNASLSSQASAVVTGALDTPGIVFYAVCCRHLHSK